MGLPIAIGGKALSSREIAPPQPIPQDASDGQGGVLEGVVLNSPPRLVIAVCPNQQLVAVCSISYYDMIKTTTTKEGDTITEKESLIAEIRVQVSPLSQAFSEKYRNNLHRISFPKPKGEQQQQEEEEEDFVPLSPSLVFSSDGRNLACLVPHPRFKESMLVTFQLRKPRTAPPAVTLPRPSYLNTNNNNNTTASTQPPLVRVATNPVATKLPNGIALTNASAICNVEAPHSSSLLLAACVDGSIVVIAYRPAQVAGILHSPSDKTNTSNCITSISHYTSSFSTIFGSRGKLVAIYSCPKKAVLFSSHLIMSETADSMLMQLSVKGEIEGSFSCGKWMSQSFLALLTIPTLSSSSHHHETCQVWPIDNFSEDNNDSIILPKEPVATLVMSVERLKEYAHGSFSLESAAAQPNATFPSSFQVEGIQTVMELQYDVSSQCLAVSSFVLVAAQGLAVPFSCIWHWRTNVVGLLLKTQSQQLLLERSSSLSVWQIPCLSKLYFCQDYSGGRWCVHYVSDSARDWKSLFQNRIRKQVYSLALLSPSETTCRAMTCRAPSSLMVSSKCVSFPSVSTPFTGRDYEFVWKNARIPASYTNAFGTPQVACIGRGFCRSIAVAACKGFCVLDCFKSTISSTSEFETQLKQGSAEATLGDDATKTSAGRMEQQPKWRLFGTETDERNFCVLAMTWWEGDSDCKNARDNVFSDDLLVAVIAVQAAEEQATKDKKDETLYLACWSPRRLDQTNQMMVRWRNVPKSGTSPTWGIRLPAGFNPSTISLLSEPLCTDAERNISDEQSWNRRAVLLLGSEGDATNGENDNVSYQLYQLEVDSDGSFYPDTEEKKYMVKAKLCSDGDLLESETSSTLRARVSGVFLVSASFDFTSVKSKSSRTLNGGSNSGTTPKTFLAAVGIIRSPCKGLEAVLISTDGVDDRKEIISGSSNSFLEKPSSEVSSYWHSHTIPFNPSVMGKSKRVEAFFVWSIELCDGSLVCWSVPYIHGSRSKSSEIRSDDKTEHASNLSDEFKNPESSMDGNGENKLHQSLFGSVTSIGESSSWIQETSVANRTGFALGCVPSTQFGCMLRSAQSGKDLHRFAPVENEDHGSAKDLDHEIFCLGSTELAPPALVPSLYASLVGRVEKVGSDPFDSHVSYMMDFSSSSLNAFTMLKSVDNEDTVLVTLRTLIIRIIELIARESDKMGNDISAQHSLFLLTTTFADICEAAKERLPPMQFVSLFLGIGRQIEPGYLVHLFPLPLSTPMPGDGQQHKCRSVEDLFQYSVRHGSISVASSALPLFSSKRHSLKMCGSLIRHCLETFEENSDSPMSVVFDLSAEERRMLRGIFHFGVRIEDSGTMPPMEPVDELDPLLVSQSMDDSIDVTDHSLHSSISNDTRQKSSARICQMFTTSNLFGSFQRPKEEEAIFDAASSFILSGFDEVKIGFESPSKSVGSRRTGDGSVSSESGEVTMAGIIASFLLPLAFPTESSKQKFRWKRTATLAQVLLGEQGNNNTANVDSNKIREMTKIAESWSLEEIIFSLQISNSSLNNSDFTTAEKEKWLVRLLKRHLFECGMMMTAAQASLVLRLVVLLLDRYTLGRDIKARSPGLLLLGIVVAHCAGHQRELLDARPRNKFTTSYATALNEIRQR